MSDRITETIAEALERDSFGLTTPSATARQAAAVVAALKAARIALIELPEPDQHGDWWGDSDGWCAWISPSGRFVNVNPGRSISKSVDTTRSLAAALLAAVEKADTHA